MSHFLTEHLKLPWTWGASCFETLLIDYHPATTWGSFQSLANVGFTLPLKPIHHVELGQRLDWEGAYVRYWLPSLSHLSHEIIYEPYLLTEEAQAQYGFILDQDYPYPVIAPPVKPEKPQQDLRSFLIQKFQAGLTERE